MRKIALLECWFGPFPAWHDFYLLTCAANPTVQFILFHDAPQPARMAENITWVRMTKPELEEKATAVLGFPVCLPNGFKVTDLRPAFGVIFREYLKHFDFWGYNDSDMFWGDIRSFLPGRILDAHDVLTGCRTSIVGQLTLFRNSGSTVAPYALIPDYQATLSRPEPGHLDEDALDEACERAGLRIYRRQLQVHDVGSTEWEERARRRHVAEKCDPAEWFWEEGTCLWKAGKLTHVATGRDVMFVHFKSWKSKWRREFLVPRLRYWDERFEGFTVGEEGIHPVAKSGARLAAALYRLRFFLPLKAKGAYAKASSRGGQAWRGVKRRLGAQ